MSVVHMHCNIHSYYYYC